MRSPRKLISTSALLENYHYLKKTVNTGKILAVIKCDAYGHGMLKVARILSAADGFAVASVQEGRVLREAGIETKILVLQGANENEEFLTADQNNLALVIHSIEQLIYLEENHSLKNLELWIKFDTGMNRLGFRPESADDIIPRVLQLPNLSCPPVLMSHFCCIDPEDMTVSNQQWRKFQDICSKYELSASMANSDACFQLPESRLQWIRAGIALYGIAPTLEQKSILKPVMRLFAPLIAIRHVRANEGIGYGHRYICPHDMTIGIVAIGYGDGYPRHAPDGTPVWLGGQREMLLGRVSMDMLAISISKNQGTVGDLVELWGTHIPVDEVAEHCGTISYELLTSAGGVRDDETDNGVTD